MSKDSETNNIDMNILADGLKDLSMSGTNAGENGGVIPSNASVAGHTEHVSTAEMVSKHTDPSLYVATRNIPKSGCKRTG